MSAGIARACSELDTRRPLVIDAVVGHKRVAKYLDAETNVREVGDVASAGSDVSQHVSRANKLEVDVLSLVDGERRGSVGSAQAEQVLDLMKPHYGAIFVDAGSMSRSGCAAWLAASDRAILVIDTTRTTQEVLQFQRKKLDSGGVALDASILNKRVHPIPKWLYWLVH